MTTLPGPLVQLDDKERDAVTEYAEGKAYKEVENHWHRLFHLVSLLVMALLAWSSWQAWSRPTERIYVQMDASGRATVVPGVAFTYNRSESSLRYHLTQFVTAHFTRRKATIAKDFANSLHYLDTTLRARARNDFERADEVGKVTSGHFDYEVDVRNVILGETRTEPYKAQVDYVLNMVDQNSRQTLESRRVTATIEYYIVDEIPPELEVVNPIGLTITHLRTDEAFHKER